MEVITYSQIGKEDIRFGTGTYEVVLADGRKVILNEVDLGDILTDSTLNSYYVTGSWTPVLTFVTPGNLSVAYTTQRGSYTKQGNVVRVNFNIITSAFTHTTASGALTITGLPYASVAGMQYPGSLAFSGITQASYTQFTPMVTTGSSLIQIYSSGSAQTISSVAAAQMPTGGSVILYGAVVYPTDS